MMSFEDITRPIHIIGAPIDLGTQRMGVDMGPNALRYAGLVNTLQQTGRPIKDLGNLNVPTPESRTAGQSNLKYADAIVEVSQQLDGKDLYVSLDLDVVDSVFAPGVGIRSHGGDLS